MIKEKKVNVAEVTNKEEPKNLSRDEFKAEKKENEINNDSKAIIELKQNETALNDTSKSSEEKEGVSKRERESGEEELNEKPEKKKKGNGEVSDAAIALCSLE